MKIKRVIELCLILIILSLTAVGASATVFVNEFLADGPSPEPQSEWIELYNNGTSQVYLTGWRLTDGEGNFTLPASVIPANGFVVLVNNQSVFNTFYSTSATVIEYGPTSTGSIDLNNNNDNIEIYDSIGTQSDQFVYAAAQVENVSYGRNYDGGNLAVSFTTPTPGNYNNRKPVISTIPNQTFAEDNNLTLNLATYITDPDSNPMNLTFTAIANVAVNLNGMVATFIPDQDFNGIRTFTVTASDGLSSTTSSTVQLNITPVNDAPRVNIPTVNFNEDSWTTLNLDTYTTDPDNAVTSLIWSRIGGDSNIGTSISATRVVTFNVTPNFCGLTSVILRANDTINYTDTTVNINVACIQDSPTITLNSPSNGANLNTTSATLQWTGLDVDNDALSYEVFIGNLATNLTSYLNTTSTSTTLTGLTNGQTVYWQVIVDDNVTTPIFSSIYSFNILTNNAPQITSYTPTLSSVIIYKNNSQNFTATATDLDNNTLTHLWQLNGSTVSTTPNYLFDSTNYAPGTYLLNYTVTDTFPSSASQIWTITVRGSNPPVFTGTIPYLSMNEGSSGNINLNNYFSDLDNDTLTYTVTAANDLMVTINNGIATVTPAAGFFGARGIKFNASDGLGQAESNIVVIVVNKINAAPTIASYSPTTTLIKTADNKELDFEVAATDPDNDPLNFKWYVDNSLQQQTTNSNHNLQEYPIQFISYGYFNAQIVVGNNAPVKEVAAANKIAQSLTETGLSANNIYNTDQARNNNLILVGTPSSNSIINNILQSHNLVLTSGGLIQMFDYNGFTALVVTGSTDDDVYDAAKILADFDINDLAGEGVSVSGTSFSSLAMSNSDTFSFTPAGGTYNVYVDIVDSSNAKTTQTWTVEVHDKPIASTFNGQTTNFDNIDLSSVNLVLEKTAYGKIEFDQPLDLREVVDLDTYVNLAHGLAAIDTLNLPELNAPATVTLYGITEAQPFIYYTSEFTTNPINAQLCSFCQLIDYSNNELKFHVDHFSTFVVKEATVAALLMPDEIQIGNDNELRNQTITTSFTITNPGTNESIDSIVIDSTASSRYNVEFSTGAAYSSEITINLQPGESKTINMRATIPKYEDGGRHSIGKVRAVNSDYSESAELYIFPESFLEIVSVEIDGDSVSDGDTAEIKPDMSLDIEVEIKNTGTADFDPVNIIATIFDLDGDVDEEVEFKVRDGDTEKKTLTFDIPDELDEDSYDLEIEIEAEDDNGIHYYETLSYTLETKKENHQLKLEASLSSESMDCIRQPKLYTRIKNLGESDEDDVKLEIKNSQLGINLGRDSLSIDEDDDYKETFDLDFTDVEEGTYALTVSVFRDGRLSQEENLNFEIKECQTSESYQQQKAQSIQQKHQDLITQALAQQSQPAVTVEKKQGVWDNDLIVTLMAIMGILTVGVMVFAIGAVIIKMGQR